MEPVPNPIFNPDGAGGSGPAREQNLVSLRIEPVDAVLEVPRGQSRELPFRALGRLEGAPDTEIDITARTVFYVPDQYLVATFPEDGSATLHTRVPTASEGFAQQGGQVHVLARAANSNGTLTEATTSATVIWTDQSFADSATGEGTPALPEDPAAAFDGVQDPTLAPVLFYPNDGALLPPNLGQLEVHFQPGAAGGSLFEVSFTSATSQLRRYTRCYADPAQFVAGACAVTLVGDEVASLAASNQGLGPVTLSVRGSDESGHYGEAQSFHIEFAEERIDGAVYYWTATTPASIVRFDFGSGQSSPETFIAPGDVPGNSGSCVGCHALSPQGDKAFFSLGDATNGQLMYVGDLSRARDAQDFYTYNGALSDLGRSISVQENRVLTGSFSPDGAQFVAAAPKNDAASDRTLFLHSGDTGQRQGSIALPFVPSHPDWSPLGDAIAMTEITGSNGVTIAFLGGGISLVRLASESWDGDHPVRVVPPTAGKNRFNPTFLPDASLLLYSEIDQSSYSGGEANACDESSALSGRFCDGYSDPGSKTWAVAPEAGATPVFLANAARPGVADALYPPLQVDVGLADLMDTFPKPAPFQSQHRGRKLTWFTVSSQRRAGLRLAFPNQSVTNEPATQSLLWMFALDAERTLAGEDGSRSGFFLPFQDLTTSNHMAQW
ncbi:MAG TPA: hypothetical protein VJU61_03315, partial [Polyangiaceae bacterium]|nr:hypothetical protein [Polyangiaceae bacterium]